jgi:sulfane dehydrogenase subunit SoxC
MIASLTPLGESYGIITPSALHFERHHAGVPAINSAEYRLMIHGLVERALVFTLDDLKRLPARSATYFIECSGNGFTRRQRQGRTVQETHGLTSCSEWTGVPLSVLLREAGLKPAASWLVAEGGDAVLMTRSIPVSKAMDDVLVAYAQNGEAIRPEQGYPVRLLVPGWEGSISVKWLRRIKVVDQPYMTREETARYTDLLPDGTARIFSFEMDPKSVITFPSGGQKLTAPGFYEISGLAWSGRGAVRRVEVSVDYGKTWKTAEFQEPVLRLAHTRFRFPWRWDGRETVIQSRCIDQRGDSQPTLEQLERVRGKHWFYHFNPIQPWRIAADGSVHNALVQG